MYFFDEQSDANSADKLNRRLILERIVSHSEFTIPVIAESSGFSMTAVSKYVRLLLDRGMVETVGGQKSPHKGRRPVVYRMKPDRYCFLGVDVKAFELNLGLMNLAGEMVAAEHIDDFRFDNTKYNIEEICSHIRDFCQREGKTVERANFNLGGRVNSFAGTSASIFNFEDNKETPLAVSLGNMLGFPVSIENDSKAMAYGELLNAAEPSWRNILYVNAGWGIGLGIIVNGSIYYGKDGYAGEFGHIYSYDNDILCHCGKKGCVETEISGRAIARYLKESVYEHKQSSLLAAKVWNREEITTMDLVNAARSGDALCTELFAGTAKKLGSQLAGLINLFNPNCIIIGGHLAEAPEECFIEPIRQAINKYSFLLMNQHLPVITSRLGHNAGIFGACMIARNRTLAEQLL